MNNPVITLAIRIGGALLFVCSALGSSAAAEAAERPSLVQDQVDWATFLARHDLVWDRPGKNYFEAPFVGNGLVGAMIWQDSANTLRLSVGRTDVTDHRTGSEPEAIVLKGRLPIGHFLLTTVGKIRGGTMRLALHDAEGRGTVETERGRISWQLLTHAEQPVNIVELVTEKGEDDCSWAFQPEESVVPRKKSPERVNPPATRETRDGVEVCVQSRPAGGDYATAWQEVRADKVRRLFISIADRYPAAGRQGRSQSGATAPGKNQGEIASSHAKTDVGAADDAVAAVRKAAAMPFEELLASHRRWWHAYYPASFISIPHARMESCYWIQR